MAPGYKPLTNAGGLTGAPGLPEEIFAAPKAITFEEIDKTNALIRAQQLQNQANEIKTQQIQQQGESANFLRDALKQQFGPQEDGTTPEFNSDAALDLAKKLALQTGDLETALNVEKVQNQYSSGGDRLLDPDEILSLQQQGLGVNDGDTVGTARLKMSLKNSGISAANLGLREMDYRGERIRPMTPAQTAKVGAANAFDLQVDDTNNTYLPYISENRGERFLSQAVNPNSAAYRYNQELTLIAKSAALALEDRVTDQDMKTIQDLTTPNDLDTMETMYDKTMRLKQYIARRKDEDLKAMTTAGFNTKGFQIPRANPGNGMMDNGTQNPAGALGEPPPLVDYSGGKLPRNSDGSPLSREQYMKLRGG